MRVFSLLGLAFAISALVFVAAIFYNFDTRLRMIEGTFPPALYRLSDNMQSQREALSKINSRLQKLERAMLKRAAVERLD